MYSEKVGAGIFSNEIHGYVVQPCAVRITNWNPYREDQHGPCARLTGYIVKRSIFALAYIIIRYLNRQRKDQVVY